MNLIQASYKSGKTWKTWKTWKMAINLEKSGKKSGKTRKMGNSQEKPEKWIFASTKIFYSVNSQIQLFWKSFTDDHFDWIIFKYVVSNLSILLSL